MDEYELETGGAETRASHFIEWLAEWAREVRRRSAGLCYLPPHRAKGLEFDHVVVLDGGWDRFGLGEGRRCHAPTVLRCHDPRSGNACPCALYGAARAPRRPYGAVPRCCSAKHPSNSPRQPRNWLAVIGGSACETSFSASRGTATWSSSASRHCLSLARRQAGGAKRLKSLGAS